MLQTAFRPSCLNRASVFEWHKRFKEGRESVRDDERCERSKEVNTPELIGQLFDQQIRHCQVLPLLARGKMGAMAVKEYLAFLKVPEILET